MGEIDDIVSSAHQPLSGPFQVGIIATLGPYLMPLILPRWRQRYPDLELILHVGLTESLIATLQSGLLDVVIATTPLHASGIDQVEIFHEPFILAILLE